MKYLPLIWSGIWRKPGRAILILLQVLIAFLLFGLLQGFKSGIDQVIARTRWLWLCEFPELKKFQTKERSELNDAAVKYRELRAMRAPAGHAIPKRPRVGVCGFRQIRGGPPIDDAPAVHHQYPLAIAHHLM